MQASSLFWDRYMYTIKCSNHEKYRSRDFEGFTSFQLLWTLKFFLECRVSVCLPVCVSICTGSALTSALMARQITFILGTYVLIYHKSVPVEYGFHHQKYGPFRQAPKYEITNFSKTAITISTTFKKFMEVITLNRTACLVSWEKYRYAHIGPKS
jgi:hypothetical protein